MSIVSCCSTLIKICGTHDEHLSAHVTLGWGSTPICQEQTKRTRVSTVILHLKILSKALTSIMIWFSNLNHGWKRMSLCHVLIGYSWLGLIQDETASTGVTLNSNVALGSDNSCHFMGRIMSMVRKAIWGNPVSIKSWRHSLTIYFPDTIITLVCMSDKKSEDRHSQQCSSSTDGSALISWDKKTACQTDTAIYRTDCLIRNKPEH